MDSTDDASSYGDIPTRPMRVKVLYSFDSDNKTNCLARFPNTLQIPAVAIDENSQVGVIELKQCLQAVMSASPDLISRLVDGDFTIYAYDYSEYETPLVGQGMLSAALSSPKLGDNSEKNMITGRVCKNIPAIFCNGVKETLEVKLRLVPVPRASQTMMHRTMDNMRMSPAMSGGFDPNAWSASMSQGWSHSPQPHGSFGMEGNSSNDSLVDDIFGLSGMGGDQLTGEGVGAAQTPRDASFGFNPAFTTDSHSAPGSRSGSPIIRSDSSARNDQLRHHSFSTNSQNSPGPYRPGSRADSRSEFNSSHKRPSSQGESQQQQNDTNYNEDEQPRKRAKVIQANWRGKSAFGSKSSDLRITASTAASMHMHRPIPKRPGVSGFDLEPPPRVPTPVPQRQRMLPPQKTQPASRSLLRQASVADSDLGSDFDQFSDAIMSSPEEESPTNSITAEGTPLDIPSSPPVFSGLNQQAPSSPGLPTLPPPRHADSGYMSGGLNSGNIFDDDENQAFVKVEGSVSETQANYYRDGTLGEMNVNMETPGDMNQLPYKMRLDIAPSRQRFGSQGSRQPKSNAAKRPPTLDRSVTAPVDERVGQVDMASRRSSITLPPLPGSFAGQSQAKKRAIQRSRTYNESEAGSPAPSDTEGRPRGPRRSGSGAPRRVVIQERLQQAIANNEMPQYCNHCGAIETPTWRKLYCKYVDGKPGALDSVEGEGETIGVEDLESDENGDVTRFVIRKSMKKTKDQTPGVGFETMQVCNPCGLWFQKYKNMRPPDKWARKSTTRKSKSKKRSADDDNCPATDGAEFQSEPYFTDQINPEDIASDNDRSASVKQPFITNQVAANRRARASSLQPTFIRRSSNDEPWKPSRLNTALSREIQSSPVRSHGSQASPIEIGDDLTPKPTRRLLFPSPRKDGETKSLNVQEENQKTPPQGALGAGHDSLDVFGAFTGKENVAPGLGADTDDDFAGLFDGSPSGAFKTPLKTPTKSTPRTLRSMTQRPKTPTMGSGRDRGPFSPGLNAAGVADSANGNAGAHDFMTSPASSRYFLRSTPSRAERTPGRNSQRSGSGNASHDVSPFSRHLAQMLSDCNDSAAFTSPQRAFDFSDLPTFTTPGRTMDWNSMEEILSSEFAAFDDSDKPQPDGRDQ